MTLKILFLCFDFFENYRHFHFYFTDNQTRTARLGDLMKTVEYKNTTSSDISVPEKG